MAGAAPWLYWNLGHHWSSLGGDANPGINRAEGFVGHLERIWREGLPVALGLKVPYDYEWITTPSGDRQGTVPRRAGGHRSWRCSSGGGREPCCSPSPS